MSIVRFDPLQVRQLNNNLRIDLLPVSLYLSWVSLLKSRIIEILIQNPNKNDVTGADRCHVLAGAHGSEA